MISRFTNRVSIKKKVKKVKKWRTWRSLIIHLKFSSSFFITNGYYTEALSLVLNLKRRYSQTGY